MSDLQCPASVVLVPRESLTSIDGARALAGRRLSGIFVDAALRADAGAFAAVSGWAGALGGCRIETLPGITEAEHFEEAVEALSDLYRGETILVVAPAAVIRAHFCRDQPPTAPIELAIDSSGWLTRAGE